ncbi:SRPBCC family protein [Pseudomonas sp. PB101]|uniref:SRPBCC family protein n=1 Tax=Pseudomonas sp. PB101 TaxID=2495428 RepID=UPI0013653116|nr:SRPBCC family protein [Pseudomonas sp. PB101]
MTLAPTNHSPVSAAISESIENGWQMPAQLYAGPHIHQIEQDAIFKKAWQCVGRESMLAKAGDYITGQLGDVPIVVVRDTEGRLLGHVNACRHRLHPVALGESGCKQLFQCRYHGWTYTHEGALRAAPGVEGCSGFQKEDLGLIPIRVDTFRGFVFANADMDAEDLHSFLGNAEELAQKYAIDFANWDHMGTITYDVDADWKLFAENSLECYHCPLVHQHTFAAHVGTLPKDYITSEFENVLSQYAPITLAPGVDDASALKGFRLIFVWPCTFISVDDFVGIVARITPTGPQRTRFTVDTFIPPGADPVAVEQWLDVYDRTFQEDKEVVAAQQRGYISGMIPQGRLMAHREASIQMFQRRTWRALQQDQRLAHVGGSAPQTINLHVVEVDAIDGANEEGSGRFATSGAKRAWEGELEIAAFEPGAEGVAVITLKPHDGDRLPEWQAGAHIDLILSNGLERQYSLCNAPGDTSQWRIGVLREPNSRGGSAYVHEQLQAQGRVKVRGPRNHFPLPEAEHYRFVAGGIGITPILAMIQLAERQGKSWQLLYGGRSLASMAFVDELRAYGDRVTIAPQDTHGLLDLTAYLGDAPSDTAVCACGPGPLLNALASVCSKLPSVSLHVEHFTPAPPASTAENTEFDLELRRSEQTLRVRKDQTVLDAVREAGLSIYSSCESGVCGTCETTVLEGAPDHRDVVLGEKERASGQSMMICVSRCKSEKLVLDL